MDNRKTLTRTQGTVERFGFPLIFATYAATLWLYPEQSVALLFGFALVGVALERLRPYHESWHGLQPDSRLDALFSLMALATSLAVTAGLTVLAARWATGSQLWPALPLPLSVLLALAVSGLGPYLLHRAAHEWTGFLWEVHAVHHAPERVYSLNAMRAHPLNAGWNVVTGLGPLMLLGADSQTILIAGGLNNFFSIWNHMNIAFRNPVWAILFNTAELHRWHHSNTREFGDRNYSTGALTLWDHVFSTWRLPEGSFAPSGAGLYGATGFPGLSFSKQLLRPLCRCA